MSFGRYLVGLAAIGAVLASLGFAACRIRARFLPTWSGARARLAEVTVAVAALCALSQILGTAGLFRLETVVSASVLVGLVAAFVLRRPGPSLRSDVEPMATALVDRREVVVAVAAVSFVCARWATWVSPAVRTGISNTDSLWYHLPIAARFVQTGNLRSLHFLNGEALVTFYPANVPLLHAVGMLAFDRDLASPLLNMAALAVALVAGWCIGQHWRQGPAGAIAVAVVMSLPVMVETMAGSAKDDVFAIAFLLAGVVFALEADRRAAYVLSGLAAGLALGSKLTMFVPVAALGLGIVLAAGRGRRRSVGAAWTIGALATGSFWYVRNLAAIGNPVPGLVRSFGSLGLPTPRIFSYERFGTTFSEFLFDGRAWDRVFVPGLEDALSSSWFVVLALAGLGTLAGVLSKHKMVRVAGVVALTTTVAYPFTPGSAFGVAYLGRAPDEAGLMFLFGFNLRYVLPAAALGLALLPALRVRDRPRTHWPLLAVLVVLLALTTIGRSGGDSWVPEEETAAVVCGVIAVMVMVAGFVASRFPTRYRWSLIAGVTILASASAAYWPIARESLETRYSWMPNEQWVRRHRGVSIAVAAFPLQYELYGPDLSNHVQYVAHRGGDETFAPIPNCREWRRDLRAGGYDYVVTPNPVPNSVLGFDLARWRLGRPPGEPPNVPAEVVWTERDPNAHEVLETTDLRIYRIDAKATTEGCD